MAELSLRDLKKIYPGGVTAVRQFNLEIEDGEFVILVGPSGCGKSTVLRMIAGLEEISGGQIHIGGSPVEHTQPRDRDIAMVFQDYALYPHMTVYQNMAFGLKMRRTPRDEIRAKVEATAEQLELTGLLRRKPRALSGGQRQRVALGRAMVRNPAVFLLDEPLSNLDAKLRTAMRAEISQLHKKLGGTFVYVTHDQTEAMTMGDKIVVMKDGLIQQAGTPMEIYCRPNNMFVAQFIGSPQMNLMPALLEQEGEGIRIRIGEYAIPLPGASHVPQRCIGGPVVLGIRPEHLEICAEKADHAVPAEILLEELLGPETHLHLEFCGNQVVARTPPGSFRRGDRVWVKFQMERAGLFDPESQAAICHMSRDSVGGEE